MSKDSSSNDEQISTSAKPATISQSVSLLDRSEEIKRKLDAWKNLGEAARDLQQKILKHRTQKAPAGLSKSKASESAKNQPLSILTSADEALREVPIDDWKIGFDKSGKFKKRIIVLEENDKSLAREYRNYGKIICHKYDLSWMHSFKKFEQSSNLEMVVAGPQINDGNTINLDHEVPAVLKSPNVPLQALSGIVAEDVVDSSENITTSDSALNTADFSVMFYHPSSHYLKECCKKFELDYFHLAYAFWARMKIGKIAHDSIPEDFHSLLNEKSNGFNCLSSYLTGSEENGDYIKNKLNGFVLDNIVVLG
uniref:Uncharacterized protein n=1 Tax=Panagrolaimus superbus TaxID=310955 RepID=A0A914ZA00_9BILA